MILFDKARENAEGIRRLGERALRGDDASGRPTCIIIAGGNGSGQCSLYQELQLPGRFINVDLVARGLDRTSPEKAPVAAGRVVLWELGRVIAAAQDFSYETTRSATNPFR